MVAYRAARPARKRIGYHIRLSFVRYDISDKEVDMICVRLEASTEDEVVTKMTAYHDRYPTAGWSTTFDPPTRNDDGSWYCTGWRGEHCD